MQNSLPSVKFRRIGAAGLGRYLSRMRHVLLSYHATVYGYVVRSKLPARRLSGKEPSAIDEVFAIRMLPACLWG